MLQTEQEPVRLEGSRGPLTREQSDKILADLKKRSPDTDVLGRHIAIEEALTDTPLSVGNTVTLLEDGKATYAAMLAAIHGAKRHVHMETYIFDDDEVGRTFAAALVERAKAGVKVFARMERNSGLCDSACFSRQIDALLIPCTR